MTFTGPCQGRGDLMETDQPRALALCQSCPSLTRCRAWVLALPNELDPFGVCGGLTERQRTNHRIPAHTCTQCEETKTGSAFNKDPHGVSGLKSYCRNCGTQRARANRDKRKAQAST